VSTVQSQETASFDVRPGRRLWAGDGAVLRGAASRLLPFTLTSLAVVLVGLPTIILPFWVDSAIFSYIGRTITEGGMPYTDAWDFKPPGIYLLYALAIQGPFDLMRNVRVFDLAWTVATCLTLVELGSLWWNRRAGVIAGLLFGVVYITSSGYWMLAQPDGWVGLPLLLAILCCSASPSSYASSWRCSYRSYPFSTSPAKRARAGVSGCGSNGSSGSVSASPRCSSRSCCTSSWVVRSASSSPRPASPPVMRVRAARGTRWRARR
jgi:hypothetical protein